MRIGYGPDEQLPGEFAQILPTPAQAVRRLLRHTPPVAEPMISRAGMRGEAHRVRSILQVTIKDQQLSGGK